jgi:hypothetical protein
MGGAVSLARSEGNSVKGFGSDAVFAAGVADGGGGEDGLKGMGVAADFGAGMAAGGGGGAALAAACFFSASVSATSWSPLGT